LKNPWYVRILFFVQKRNYGVVLNSARTWAKSPRVFMALSFLYGVLERKSSPLTPSLRSLVIVRISQMNGCGFCIDLNTATLLKRSVSLEKVAALARWKTSDLFDDFEKLVLEYSEAVTLSTGPVDGVLQERVQTHFTQSALVDLTALIAFQNMSTKFNNAFGIPVQGFCPVEHH
jgi:AhpD family alkylhydroperoxidase